MVSTPPKKTSTRARGDFLKWIYLVLLFAGPSHMFFSGVTPLGVALSSLGIAGTALVALVWFLSAWSSIPPEDRHGTELGRYSFFWVFMRFFIPIYGFFWLFVSIGILCKAINESLSKREMPMRASAPLGITAAIAHVIVSNALLLMRAGILSSRDLVGWMLGWTAAGIVSFLFMATADHARRFMILASLAERERNDATSRRTFR